MEKCEVRIQIPTEQMSVEQCSYLFKAEKYLSRAGVRFDTGMDLGTKARDWEFDWSLKGANVLFKKMSDGLLPSGKPIGTKPTNRDAQCESEPVSSA